MPQQIYDINKPKQSEHVADCAAFRDESENAQSAVRGARSRSQL